MMDDEEFKRWVLVKMIGGSPTPEQVSEAVKLLTGLFMPSQSGSDEGGQGRPGRHENGAPKVDAPKGPPEGDHDHNPAPYAAVVLSAEGLVLRALERAGNVLLNDGKRGKDRDRVTPPFTAHTVKARSKTYIPREFDFSLARTVFCDLSESEFATIYAAMGRYCADLYNTGEPYSREGLAEALGVR
jgi:hypothetical protein